MCIRPHISFAMPKRQNLLCSQVLNAEIPITDHVETTFRKKTIWRIASSFRMPWNICCGISLWIRYVMKSFVFNCVHTFDCDLHTAIGYCKIVSRFPHFFHCCRAREQWLKYKMHFTTQTTWLLTKIFYDDI